MLSNAWIKWNGGDCPVPGETKVFVKFGNSEPEKEPCDAGRLEWSHIAGGTMGDISEYRIHQPERTKELAALGLVESDFEPVEPMRCKCCGYLVTESEHKGCLRAAEPAPDYAMHELLDRVFNIADNFARHVVEHSKSKQFEKRVRKVNKHLWALYQEIGAVHLGDSDK